MDALRTLKQEILELRVENRALREETEMLRGRQPAPAPVQPAPVPQPPPAQDPPDAYAPPAYVPPVYAPLAYAPPPVYVSRRMNRRVLNDEGISVSEFLKLQTPEFMGE